VSPSRTSCSLDAATESITVGLILVVTAGILWLTLRASWLPLLLPTAAIVKASVSSARENGARAVA